MAQLLPLGDPLGNRARLSVKRVTKGRIHVTREGNASPHVALVRAEAGFWFLEDLGERSGTWVDGEQLAPGQQVRLRDGCLVRLGPQECRFVDESERQAVPSLESLVKWWNRAEKAPEDLPRQVLRDVAYLCETTFLRSSGEEHVRAWYRAYHSDPDVNRSCLPVPLPYLADLGALVALRQPPLRRGDPREQDADRPGLRALFAREYQQRHLCLLAYRPAVKLIRARVAALRKPAAQVPVIARYLGALFGWAVDAWLRVDYGGNKEAIAEAYERMEGPMRILTRPADIQGFLIQLSRKLQRGRALREVIPPLERFLIAARTRVPTALADFDAPLIDECLCSQALEERDYSPDPLARVPWMPRIPSPAPGEHTAVRRVRKTNRLEKLPEVIPQDFVIARVRPGGQRWLMEKLHQEGLLIWERQDYDSEVRRNKFLVCFVADIGPDAQPEVGGANPAAVSLGEALSLESAPARRRARRRTSASVHARRLIVEHLRDLATFVRLPDVHMDVHVFLEPVGGLPQRRLNWALTLQELQQRLGKSPHDDMLEIEELAAGYFFPRHGSRLAPQSDHRQFIEQVFERGDQDLTVFVFLGPRRTLRVLLPYEPPPPRQVPGARDVIRLVQLGQGPNTAEVAREEGFAELRLEPAFDLVPDLELRYALLQEILGRPRAAGAPPDELFLEEGEDR